MASNKKKARRIGAILAFLDESGFSEKPSIRRTWSPKGVTPVIVAPFTWKNLSAIAVLATNAYGKKVRLFLRLLPGSIRSAQIKIFIGSLRKHFRKKVILLWDRLPSHRSNSTQRYIMKQNGWLTNEWFPPYSPELNPVEYFWSYISATNLANFRARGIDSVAHQIRKVGCKVRNHNNLGRAFIKHSGLF